MHLHHAYGNNAYPVIPAGQVLPADESARFDMGITHIFKVNGNKLHRTDTGLCKLLFNQLQHDRLSAAADTGHDFDNLLVFPCLQLLQIFFPLYQRTHFAVIVFPL